MIRYEGRKIDRESLLRYLISFRQHNEFHEQCVERIFNDIKQSCRPEKLSVFARYPPRHGHQPLPQRFRNGTGAWSPDQTVSVIPAMLPPEHCFPRFHLPVIFRHYRRQRLSSKHTDGD